MHVFEKTPMKATLSLAVIALSMTVTSVVAEESSIVPEKTPVVAKLLILPGNNMPAGMSDVDSPTREVSLSGTLEGSSSHTGENGEIEIINDTVLGKSAPSAAKTGDSSIAKRKSTRTKKQPVKVARTSIPRRTVKRRAALMMGVYR